MSVARLACLLGALCLASCTPTEEERTAATVPTLAQIENSTYTGIHDEPVILTNGRFEGAPFVAGGTARLIVALRPELVARDDFDGDGAADAAVILTKQTGGSGTWVYLAALANARGELANTDTVLLGERVEVRSIAARDGVVHVELVEHAPADPQCCPTLVRTREWTVEDGRLAAAEASGGKTVPVAAAESAERHRGQVTWGHEARSFVPCDSEVAHWIVDETAGDLPAVYESLASAPYQPIFVELEGTVGPAPSDGFGADYDAGIRVKRVSRAEREGRGCADDLAGLEFRARGNEPFWMLEIRATAMRLVEPGTPERSWSIETVQAGPETWRYASRDDDPNGPLEGTIRTERCRDSMSGAYFGYVAEVMRGDELLRGCAARGFQ